MHIILILALIAGVSLIRLFFSEKDTRKIETIYSGVLIFLYAALRGQTVGIDLPNYSNNYTEISFWSIDDILHNSASYTFSRDPFFWVVMKILTFISSDPQIMIVAVSAIVALSISVLIYRSKTDVLLCFLIFICLRYYSFTFTGLRQAIAMSVLIFAVKYLETKKFVPFILITLIAAAFHASALVFLLAYPIMLIKKTQLLLLVSFVFLIFAFAFNSLFSKIVLFVPFFNDRFSNYLEMSETLTGKVIFGIYLIVLIFILIQQKQIRTFIVKKTSLSKLKLKEIIRVNTNITLYYNFLIIGTTISLIGMSYSGLFRIAYFFLIPGLFFLLPWAINYYQKLSEGIPLKLVVIVLLIFQFIIIGPGAGTEEYLFFWE